MKYTIDETDAQIIDILIKNGRTPYADIAKQVGMKSPSVIERIKKLELEGVIKKYTTEINYKKLGYDITAFIGISIDNTQHITDFEQELSNISDDIIECHHVTGDFTMILKAITKNTSTLSKLIKKLRNINGVQKTNTILVFSTILDAKRLIKDYLE
jgi:Lrp/AsnC family leucine-responsive transcriptional regulator